MVLVDIDEDLERELRRIKNGFEIRVGRRMSFPEASKIVLAKANENEIELLPPRRSRFARLRLRF
jgi:hypothetical protein